MVDSTSKLSLNTEETAPARSVSPSVWHPFEGLRQEVDRLFDEFDKGLWHSPFRRSAFDLEPFWRRGQSWGTAPAVDIVEKDNGYEMTAELPGIDEKNLELKLEGGTLTIKGEKREDKEEKKKDYYLQERRFGSFERRFAVPDNVDLDKIEAGFKKGVLTITLPKKPEAKKPEKKIEVKTA
jgi:HSP20 family protein